MIIKTLDTFPQTVPQATAVFLVEGPAGPLLVETGPAATTGNILPQLAAYGYEPNDIQHVLVTHIHMDHAGAAGWWAQHGAQIYVHERGAPHLVDPSRLMNSAARIYGDDLERLFGQMIPIPSEQVTVVHDQDVLKLNGLEILVLETPGHANHHHAFQIGDVAFTGDSAGVHLPGSPFPDIPAPPPEFHRERWQATVKKLQGQNLRRIYPTHFGEHDNVAARLVAFSEFLDSVTELVGDCLKAGLERDEIVKRMVAWQDKRLTDGGADEATKRVHEVASPLEMNVDGISRYWRKYHGVG